MEMNKENLIKLFEKIKSLEIPQLNKENWLEYEDKNRNKKIEFLKGIEILNPQPNRENPHIIENYPYGFLKTKMRYFAETNKKGQRIITQTLNPKTNLWNKEKLGNYYPIVMIYKDLSNNHIEYFSIDAYDYLYTIEPLILSSFDFMSNEQKEQLKYVVSILYTNCFLNVTIGEYTTETEEETKLREEKHKKNKEDIKHLFYNVFATVNKEVV